MERFTKAEVFDARKPKPDIALKDIKDKVVPRKA